MGARLGMRKEHQATQELLEVSLHEGVPFLGCLCLTPSGLTSRAYNNPILKTEFLHISYLEENLDIGDLCPFPLFFAE